ncbi:MAG: cysteine-rich CWC family protein [Sphingomonadaceae bacterium]
MSICSRCGASFGCAMVDADNAAQPCWCTLLPAVMALPGSAVQDASCWCPVCLRAALAALPPVPPLSTAPD